MTSHIHLWQNRFYSCPAQDAYFLPALGDVEQNPCPAGILADPLANPAKGGHRRVLSKPLPVYRALLLQFTLVTLD
jgi:hypothetical protein